MTNEWIADRLALYAGLLELDGARPFASRAYRRAADVIRASPAPVAQLVRSGVVRELRGIGPGIEGKLRELVETGAIAELGRLERELRPELAAFGQLLGLRAPRMVAICNALGIETPEEFRAAAAAGRLTDAPGVGPVTATRLQAALDRGLRPRRGLTLDRAHLLLREIANTLGGVVAGDPRRYLALSEDLAVVVPADDPSVVLERFRALPVIVTVLEEDARSACGLTVDGLPVRLVVAEPAALGSELVRATGSAEYVRMLGPLAPAPDEETVFESLGMSWRPPELRELPLTAVPDDLIDVTDVRGELHCHTTWSDGRASVVEMAVAARERGYEYIAICDHTPSVRVVPGLDADELRRQAEEIEAANRKLAPFRVLRGVECDILPDGSLDVDEAVLAELDWVQISLHAGQRRSREELTRIVSEAMRRPHVRALSHPTGRILHHRPENQVDLDEIFTVAVETGVALEINGLADRIDLSAEHARDAVAAGVHLVVCSDAHSARGLANVELAVHTARRAAVPTGRVLNTLPLDALLRRA